MIRNLSNTLGLLPSIKRIRDFSTGSRNKLDKFNRILLHDIPFSYKKQITINNFCNLILV